MFNHSNMKYQTEWYAKFKFDKEGHITDLINSSFSFYWRCFNCFRATTI